MNQITIAQLLHGSAELDRMKKEINQLVGMISGFAWGDPAFKNSKTLEYVFEDGSKWYVERSSLGLGRFTVQYCSQSGDINYSMVSGTVRNQIKYKNVQEIHERLKDFLNLMVSNSETIAKNLAPVLKAANRNCGSA